MILWAINVYDRLEHLWLQQNRIREWFGERVYLYVFSNGSQGADRVGYREDRLHIHPTNGGHHQGVLDAYHQLLSEPWLDAAHTIVWSHADSIFSDYAVVDRWLAEFAAGTDDVLTVGDQEFLNTRHRDQGIVPWCYNDFTVWTPTAYRRVFPIAAPLSTLGDLYDPVEVVLGRAIRAANLRVVNYPAWYAWHLRPSRFEFPEGLRLSCDNTIDGCERVLAGPIEEATA